MQKFENESWISYNYDWVAAHMHSAEPSKKKPVFDNEIKWLLFKSIDSQ